MLQKCYEKVKSLGLDYLESIMKSDDVRKRYDCTKILLKIEDSMKVLVKNRNNAINNRVKKTRK